MKLTFLRHTHCGFGDPDVSLHNNYGPDAVLGIEREGE